MREPSGPIDVAVARRNTRRRFALLAVCPAVLIVLGAVALGLALARSHGHRRNNAISASLGLLVVIILLSAGLIVAYRLSQRPNAQRVQQHSWQRRRRVMSALQRGQLEPEDRPVAEALMYSNRHWRLSLWLFAAFALGAVLDAVLEHGLHRALAVLWAFCFVIFIPLYSRQQRRLGRNYDRIVRADPPPETADRSEPYA